MERSNVSRRTLLKNGGAALAGLSLQVAGPAHAFSPDDNRERQTGSETTARSVADLGQPATWSSRGATNRRFPTRTLPEPAGWESATLVIRRNSLRRSYAYQQWPGRGSGT